MSTVVADVAVEDYVMAMVVESVEGLMPTYEEACRHPDWPKWDKAIQKELWSEKESGTWKIVECPEDANVVDNRWVLHIKKNAAGKIEKYKAWLVAKGFTQIYGIDYYETYAPVAKLASFRLLALAAHNSWPVDTFNFNSAYLNSPLGENETIYLGQPIGYETEDHKQWVWKLLKTLYGLKQGVKNWYDVLCYDFILYTYNFIFTFHFTKLLNNMPWTHVHLFLLSSMHNAHVTC